ncbi:MAG TPA: D-alanyl-D-alanine carboxypeptidase family protein [Stellaceae bacterium]|nr:D-alanyl-D-alanine carboxypeptidase family protein [Stellaceae bacterium]
MMLFGRRKISLFVGLWIALAGASLNAATIDTKARNAIIVDFDTGAVILDKNADEPMPPASMSKIMTAYLVYEALKKGKLSLEDMLPVSEKAWRTGGSKMFVPYPGRVKVEDLIRGMIVQSGNDACIVLAEGLAGSEEAFVEQMNEKAKELGLANSHFTNVSGLPDSDEHMTARDLATLARRLITDFPEYYHYDAEKDFTFNKIRQGNRNPLLYKDLGADGLKTGHTEEAGYCLTASAIRDGRRIIMVLGGMDKAATRAQESERLLEWAFREFGDYRLFKKGDVIDQADVWLGTDPKVPVTTTKDVVVTLPRAARRSMKVVAHYDRPARAPVTQGTVVGKLVITAEGVDPAEFPLVASQSVQQLGPLGRVAVAAGYLIWGNR